MKLCLFFIKFIVLLLIEFSANDSIDNFVFKDQRFNDHFTHIVNTGEI